MSVSMSLSRVSGVGLAAVLAAGFVATGCDAAELGDAIAAEDTDGADEADDADGDGGDGDAAGETADDSDGSGGAGSGPGSDGGDTPGDNGGDEPTPFDNDPSQVYGALSGMGYVCYDGADTRYHLLFTGAAVALHFEDGSTTQGTYDVAGSTLSLSFPELGFAESASQAVVELDALVYFETPSVRCGAWALDHTAMGEAEVVKCPTVKYLPGTSWEDNEFHFGPGGTVKRRRWTELPMIPDTLYAERWGIYRQVDDRVYIALPFDEDGEHYLTGTVVPGEGLYVDQLEPDQGACQ